jgi:hypothetical protein
MYWYNVSEKHYNKKEIGLEGDRFLDVVRDAEFSGAMIEENMWKE